MRRIFLGLLIVGMAASPALGATLPPGGTFVDDDPSIFESDIEALAAEGVTKGCNPERTSFCPTRNVTRGQMAAFLVRAIGLTEQDPSIDFTDDDTSIFENDIEKLATAGITKGCGDGTTFCPDQTVTRGQMAAFLVRALELKAQDPSIDFTDDDTSQFENDIEKLATAGITKGCGDGTTFCPNDGVTRGQMAAFLTRAYKYPKMTVPERGETTLGIDLAIAEAAFDNGCAFNDGDICQATITISDGQSFFFDEGWFAGPWSLVPSADRAIFSGDDVRTEAKFNGTKIDVVELPVVVTDDLAEKLVTFQFPNIYTGTHRIEIIFTDDDANFEMSIEATIVISSGAGASLGVTQAKPGDGPITNGLLRFQR